MLFNEKTTETIKMCRCCFMCRHACPTFLATKLDSHTPRGYAINLSRINEGHTDWDEKGFERLFHCSQCGLCTELCEFSWPEDEMVLEGRREMIKAGKEPEEVKKVRQDVVNSSDIENNLFDGAFYDKKGCDILYIAGSALTNGQECIIKNTCAIIQKTGLSYTMQKKEDISGIVLGELGYQDRMDEWVQEFVKRINKLEAGTVVVSCAHTYDFIKKSGLIFKNDAKVLHTVEFIRQMMADGRLTPKKTAGRKIMYHDPCRIGRGQGLYEAPREIIKANAENELTEFMHSKSEAECCGAGASVHLTYPGVASKVAGKRMEQAAEAEADVVITACPNCKKVFEQSQSAGGKKIEIMDISEYVFECLS